jgi:hypothetical protein
LYFVTGAENIDLTAVNARFAKNSEPAEMHSSTFSVYLFLPYYAALLKYILAAEKFLN